MKIASLLEKRSLLYSYSRRQDLLVPKLIYQVEFLPASLNTYLSKKQNSYEIITKNYQKKVSIVNINQIICQTQYEAVTHIIEPNQQSRTLSRQLYPRITYNLILKIPYNCYKYNEKILSLNSFPSYLPYYQKMPV